MKRTAKRVYDENSNVTHKVCSKCEELKGIEEFYKKKGSFDGHTGKCKKCEKEYYEENKKEILEREKKYRKENKERLLEYHKKYYEENKEEINKKNKEYREENKEQILEYQKRRYEENKEQMLEYRKKHREENKEYYERYREENKEQIKEQRKRHYEENRERLLVCQQEHYKDLCDETITRIKTIVEQDPTRYNYKDDEEIYGIIYFVYCKPTNKYYVGQTKRGFDNRYLGGFFNDEGHRRNEKLMEDLEKYGEDSFEFTKLFKVAHSKEELDDLEVYYIDYFDSYYNGYNRTRGNHHQNL